MIYISVIIPIYKAEDYIERCARSLMEQTMKEGIEFLFINDCTPDNSMAILRNVIVDYPERRHQVRVIENRINLGVSATRKIGVKEAKGEYIGWCDADDWCEVNMYEKMFTSTNNQTKDIVVCDYWVEKGQNSECIKWVNCSTPQDCIINMWKGYYLPGSFWQQICRKSILQKSIEMIKEVNYSEDVYATILSCYYAHTISYVNVALYHYNQNNLSSLVHNIQYSYNDWICQKMNIETIVRLLYQDGGWKKYHVACNALKHSRKVMYRSSFKTITDYYYTFREAYKDVNKFFFTSERYKLRTFLVYNCFFLFWLKFHNIWNK